jgi:hypothetical protein
LTALLLAAQNGDDKCVEVLLNAGCDVNALNDAGISALQYAVEKAHIDCVRTLVRCGAEKNNANVQFRGVSLDDLADRTSIADELKAALRVPADKRRRCEQCSKTTSAKLQKCAVCRKVYYCNRECQLAHWQQHRLMCSVDDIVDSTIDALKATVRHSAAKKRRHCEQCDKTALERMQKCSVCRAVLYCDRECQVAHWEQHKLVCNGLA